MNFINELNFVEIGKQVILYIKDGCRAYGPVEMIGDDYIKIGPYTWERGYTQGIRCIRKDEIVGFEVQR